MIEAVIFDMDGVILDSEPLWTEAQKEVFTPIGVNYDEELAVQTIGLDSYDTIDFWYRRQPWEGVSYKEIEERICARMIILLQNKGSLTPGLKELLDFFKAKGLKIGLASGSPFFIIEHVLELLGIKNYFEVIYSADNEEYGKPHPAVFLSAAKKLGVPFFNCLVIEDSFNGLIAAKSARMKAIAYLPNGDFHSSRFDFADLKLSSFTEFNESHFKYLQNLA